MKPQTSIKPACLWALFTVLAFSACKKEAIEPKPTPVEEKRYLNKVLHPYVHPTEVDSAIAKWKVGAVEKSVKLFLHNDSLSADVKTFSIDAGIMTVQIYSNKKLENKSLQYERALILDLKHTHNIRINGPESFGDQNWKPRIIFKLRESNNLNIVTIF
jgi:hypothetical protein